MQSPTGKPRLLDQIRDRIRLKHYSYRTEQTYVEWAKRFILFHNKRHPQEMGKTEVEAFLTHLAVTHKVSASTPEPGTGRDPLSLPRGARNRAPLAR